MQEVSPGMQAGCLGWGSCLDGQADHVLTALPFMTLSVLVSLSHHTPGMFGTLIFLECFIPFLKCFQFGQHARPRPCIFAKCLPLQSVYISKEI